MYRIIIKKLFRLSLAVMISHPMPCIDPLLLTLQHPSIGYKGGNPLTGKDRYVWLANYKELFYNFLPALVQPESGGAFSRSVPHTYIKSTSCLNKLKFALRASVAGEPIPVSEEIN